MSESPNSQTVPRSIRHKRILDVAADDPDASVEEIASKVPSATPDLVERVLDDYGDPAVDGGADPDGTGNDSTATEAEPSHAGDGDRSMTDEENGREPDPGTPQTSGGGGRSSAGERTYPDPDDLSAEQRETLRTVYEHPDASQREVAARLDVTGPTVSRRVNAIEGFDWSDREAFCEAVFDTTTGSEGTAAPSDSDREPSDAGEPGHTDTENTEARSEVTASGPEADPGSGSTTSPDDPDTPGTETDPQGAPEGVAADLSRLNERVEAIEQRVEAIEQLSDDAGEKQTRAPAFEDPDLVHKVVHACLQYDAITEEEERRILRDLLGG